MIEHNMLWEGRARSVPPFVLKRRVMKAVYFYMDTVVAVRSLWNGKRFVTAKWDGKSWHTLTDKDMPPVVCRKEAEANLQRWADRKELIYAGCHGCGHLSVGVCGMGETIKRLICGYHVYFVRPRCCPSRMEIEDNSI